MAPTEIINYHKSSPVYPFVFNGSRWVPSRESYTTDPAMLDPFSRQRVSSPYTILDLKQIYNPNPLFYDEQGTGTSLYLTNKASTRLIAGAGQFRTKQSKLRGTYLPGKGMLCLITGVLWEAPNGCRKELGYGDENNGLFFRRENGQWFVVKRSFNSGSPVDYSVPQSLWNIDKMNGAGGIENPSGINLSPNKTNIYVIDFEWLGVGRVRFLVNINGKFFPVHEMNHANIEEEVYMSNPNLPIRFHVNNNSGVESYMDTICASIISEGGQEDTAAAIHVSRGAVPVTLGSEGIFTPIISCRFQEGRFAKISPINVDLFSPSAVNYEWRLLLNPVVTGPDNANWVDYPNSTISYDTSRDNTNVLTGGHAMAGGYGSSTNQNKIPIQGLVKSFLTIGKNIDGSSDELVLGVSNITGSGVSVYGGFTLSEYV